MRQFIVSAANNIEGPYTDLHVSGELPDRAGQLQLETVSLDPGHEATFLRYSLLATRGPFASVQKISMDGEVV